MYFKLVCKKSAYCQLRDHHSAVKESVVLRQL